jgi:hypothetical protein
MKKLIKYNLGFKWFGPLEPCNDGKFYLVTEVDQQWAINERDLNHKIKYLEAGIVEKDTTIAVLHQQLSECNKINRITSVVLAFGAVSIMTTITMVIALWANL